MALATYTDLQAAVADYMARSDLTSQIVDAIALCEARLNYGHDNPDPRFSSDPLRVREMETRTAVTFSAEYTALPTDFLEMRRVRVLTSPEAVVNYVTPEQFSAAAASATSGTPTVYTIEAGYYRLGPIPASVSGEILYYAKIPALASNATNWLLTAYPNVYLYGALVELCLLIKEDERLPVVGSMFASAVSGLAMSNKRGKFAGSTLQMRPVSGTF